MAQINIKTGISPRKCVELAFKANNTPAKLQLKDDWLEGILKKNDPEGVYAQIQYDTQIYTAELTTVFVFLQ